MEFSKILKELREKNNYTQEELGALLNLSKNAISHYENETNQPSLDTVVRLADIFNVSIDYLLGRTPNNISHTKMTQKYINNMTIAEIIEKMLLLDSDHRRAITDALMYILFHNRVYDKKNYE